MINRRSPMLAGLATLAVPIRALTADPAVPPYQIVLRSRHAEATPQRSKEAQTGGGTIVVEQPDLNTIIVTMTGSAVVGSEFCGSAASLDFNLEQDLDIIPTRKGLRAPRIGLLGRVVGTLAVSDSGKHGKGCGSAEQGPAFACLTSGGTSLLTVNVKSTSAGSGQESSLNFREGPIEAVTAEGAYRLAGSFHVGVTQGKGIWNRHSAVADFDPAPQLDAFWTDALRSFRAVKRRDFGFTIALRVVEDAAVVPVEKAP